MASVTAAPPSRLRYVATGFALLQTATMAGVVFAWPAVSGMLQREGVFAERCGVADAPCAAQQKALAQVY